MAEKKNTSKKKDSQAKTGSFMKELLSGTMVTEKIILKNLWYILLITLLAAIYIGNRFHAEKITRESTRLQREVKDLRAESLATSADLMYLSRQSEVYDLVRERGLNLEELKTSPFKLLVDKK
ncbi:MAG: FtsL-like putative cell division protein [Bacteroidales bacterium]|jgi:cell division protein FtsL|nr:FtsL-like putative cell division protein [Bacteroidales bacterium]